MASGSADRAAWPEELVEEICKLADGPTRSVIAEGTQAWAEGYMQGVKSCRLVSNSPHLTTTWNSPELYLPHLCELKRLAQQVDAPHLPHPACPPTPDHPSPRLDFNALCAMLAAFHDQYCNLCDPLWPNSHTAFDDWFTWKALRETCGKANMGYMRAILNSIRAELRNRGILPLAGGTGNADSTPPAAERGDGNSGKAVEKKPRKRKRKVDPKIVERRNQRKAQQKIEDTIHSDWDKGEWTNFQDYATWKNEYLPKGWLKLDKYSVGRAVENASKRRNRRRNSAR